MPRYVSEFSMVYDANGLFAAVEQYLRSEGYEYTQFERENVFKKGMGLATGPTFFRFFVHNGNLRLEAWLKFAILPGVYAGEMDLEGVMGCAMKAVLRGRVQHIENMIMQFGGRPLLPAYVPPQPCQPQQPVQPQSSAPAFCGRCGTKLPVGVAFCPGCGSAVK